MIYLSLKEVPETLERDFSHSITISREKSGDVFRWLEANFGRKAVVLRNGRDTSVEYDKSCAYAIFSFDVKKNFTVWFKEPSEAMMMKLKFQTIVQS